MNEHCKSWLAGILGCCRTCIGCATPFNWYDPAFMGCVRPKKASGKCRQLVCQWNYRHILVSEECLSASPKWQKVYLSVHIIAAILQSKISGNCNTSYVGRMKTAWIKLSRTELRCFRLMQSSRQPFHTNTNAFGHSYFISTTKTFSVIFM